jgi:hypothetical protein
MAIGTTNISMANIYGEVNNTLPGGTNNSLQTLSSSAANTGHTSTISGYTSPGGGLTGAPYGMGEFGGYVNLLQWESNVDLTHSSNTFAAEFDETTAGTSLVFGLIEYNINIYTIELNNNYYVYFGIEEEDAFNGAGLFYDSGNNGSATSMTTGTTYPMQRIEFTQANFPDSYTITASNTINSNQIGLTVTEAAGQGGNYAASADWSGNSFNNGTPTTFTLQEPGTSNNSAGVAVPLTTHGVQINGSVSSSSATTRIGTAQCTYTLTFKKSGYPDRQATSHIIANEMTLILQSSGGGGGPR